MAVNVAIWGMIFDGVAIGVALRMVIYRTSIALLLLNYMNNIFRASRDIPLWHCM